jgi:hypothetical protein
MTVAKVKICMAKFPSGSSTTTTISIIAGV